MKTGVEMLSNHSGKLLKQYVKDYVVFDLETTGISCKTDDVIEISAIKVMDEKVVGEFSTLVNPGRPIPPRASAVNGIYDDMVMEAPSFEEALRDFIDFIEEYPLVGHNIYNFDMKFLYRDCQKYFGKTIDNDYIDTLKLSWVHLKELPKHRLVDVAAHYKIDSKGAHRALNDCRMNQLVFYCMGRDMLKES